MINFDSLTWDETIAELSRRMALYAPTLQPERWYAPHLGQVLVPVRVSNWESLSGDQRRNMKKWCQERFDDRWVWSFDTYYFVDPKEALAFRLRWL